MWREEDRWEGRGVYICTFESARYCFWNEPGARMYVGVLMVSIITVVGREDSVAGVECEWCV